MVLPSDGGGDGAGSSNPAAPTAPPPEFAGDLQPAARVDHDAIACAHDVEPNMQRNV